jgi:hypothetical protein
MNLKLLEDVSARLVALRHARQAFSRRLAPDFSPFAFINSDELTLSRMLAWVLNPDGSHAQGAVFLDEFVRIFTPDLDLESASPGPVLLEAPCGDRRRIDILVKYGRSAIAIENKPSAADQEGQLEHYLGHLQAYNDSRLIYLTGNAGRLPAEHSLPAKKRDALVEAGRLILMSYADLQPWLTACRGLSDSERVRAFIDDFQRYILARFEGVTDMTEQAMLIEQMTSDAQRVEAAAKIAISWREAQHVLIQRLQQQLDHLTPEGWTIAAERFRAKNAHMDIVNPAWAPLAFRVVFDAGNYNEFAYGLVRPGAPQSVLATLKKALDAELGEGSRYAPQDEWAWWRYTSLQDEMLPVVSNWGASSEPWQAIADGSLAPRIIEAAKRVLDAARRAPIGG